MRKVLITGFEPFGGDHQNSSLELIRRLHGETVKSATIVTKLLPCVFGEAVDTLLTEIDRIHPESVICLGQSKGATEIALERVALNLIDAQIPDNQGNQPVDVPVLEQGPVAYWSTLPVRAIVKELKQHGIPAKLSQSAGTYVCNSVFYGLMHSVMSRKRPIPAGFIHLPALPEQVIGTGQPSMHLDLLVKALQLIVQTIFSVKCEHPAKSGSTPPQKKQSSL